MKTTKFRLFATMITLAAVITAIPFSTNAQRRASQTETSGRESRSSAPVQKKSISKSVKKSSSRSGQATETRRASSVTRRSSESRTGYSSRAPQSVSAYGGHRDAGKSVKSNRDYYRINSADKRYTPSRNYKGTNKTWSASYRSPEMNYNHSGKSSSPHRSFYAKKHWNKKWEGYRWNDRSWRDYYHGYNPYSYRNSKYYFHHPRYGHVVRRFDVRPPVFFHNHKRYYSYDGHFFRYQAGIGYVLVNLPYGFTFDFLPGDYSERVYINGYPYFRVGNMFFEAANHGYRLIHFPERYYAYDDAYQRPGIHFSVDLDLF